MRRKGTNGILVGVAALGLVAAGCATGSGESGASNPSIASSSTLNTTTTVATPTTTTTPTPTAEKWLESVREVEAFVIEADMGWVPWTSEVSDSDLLALQAQWCSTAVSVGDVSIENSPDWLRDHPVVEDIEDMLTESGTMSQDQLDYSTEVLLPQMLLHDLCGELQPGYDRRQLLEEFRTETLAILDNAVAVLPSSPDGELFEDMLTSVFGTCTNIDTNTPGAIAGSLLESVFESDDDITRLTAVGSMRTAASYVCPGRSSEKILQWAEAGYPYSLP